MGTTPGRKLARPKSALQKSASGMTSSVSATSPDAPIPAKGSIAPVVEPTRLSRRNPGGSSTGMKPRSAVARSSSQETPRKNAIAPPPAARRTSRSRRPLFAADRCVVSGTPSPQIFDQRRRREDQHRDQQQQDESAAQHHAHHRPAHHLAHAVAHQPASPVLSRQATTHAATSSKRTWPTSATQVMPVKPRKAELPATRCAMT